MRRASHQPVVDDRDAYFTYRPLSNLPTPPPSSRTSSAAQSPRTALEDGEVLTARYRGTTLQSSVMFTANHIQAPPSTSSTSSHPPPPSPPPRSPSSKPCSPAPTSPSKPWPSPCASSTASTPASPVAGECRVPYAPTFPPPLPPPSPNDTPSPLVPPPAPTTTHRLGQPSPHHPRRARHRRQVHRGPPGGVAVLLPRLGPRPLVAPTA